MVTRETKTIMGVTTTVVREIERKRGVLREDARNWFAQDKRGNVWYFGEEVDNYTADGKLKDHGGSWEAGVKEAKPGIIMPATPKVGDTYRQEYLQGQAEDMGTVVALDQKVTVAAGTFDDCLQIKDWSKIETSSEFKYYCPTVGFLVLEESTTPRGWKTGVGEHFHGMRGKTMMPQRGAQSTGKINSCGHRLVAPAETAVKFLDSPDVSLTATVRPLSTRPRYIASSSSLRRGVSNIGSGVAGQKESRQ